MKLFEQLQQLERLDALIRKEGTGQPPQLAERLGVSERTVYSMLDVLRGFGAEIDYCRRRQSYCCRNKIKFDFKLVEKPDTPGDSG
jgi:predicted DNA-binding transcriptional regulator YafY